MQTKVTDAGDCRKKITITLTEEEIAPHIDKAFQKARKKIRVDGFREGKVPVSLVKKRFGDAIKADAVDDIIQAFYSRAIDAENLDVVAPGQVGDVDFEEGKPFIFEAEVEVRPEFKLADFKGIKAEKEMQKISDEDVKIYMEMIREQGAEINEIGEGAEKGDIITGDVQELNAAGVPIVGKKYEDWSIELGKGPIGEQLTEPLNGVKAEEERRFTIMAPAQGEDGKVQNQESHYMILVKKVLEKKLPDLDDAFAKTREFDSIAAMTAKVRESLEAEANARAERVLNNRLIDEIVKKHDFAVPSSMVENGLNHLWEDYEKQPRQQPVEKEKFFEENRAGVIWNIKWSYIWREIAADQSIEIGSPEIDAEVEKMAKSSPNDEKKIRILYKEGEYRERLRDRMQEEAVLRRIRDEARIKEVVMKPKKKRIIS